MDGSDNPRVVIGGNLPPEPTPPEAFAAHIADIMADARTCLFGKPIETDAQADAVGALLKQLRTAKTDADAARTVEKKPHMDAGKAVDEAWKPVIASADLGVKACKAALQPYLDQKDREARQAAEEARQEAQRQAEAAAAAIRAADATDLEAREAAEALVKQAKAAEGAASRAEKVTAAANGGGRKTSLRSVWRAQVADMAVAGRHYWATNPEPFRDLVKQLADQDCRAGKRQAPGVTFTEERVVA